MPNRFALWLACGGAVVALVWLGLAFAGTVAVKDRTGEVEAAFVTDERESQRLFRLPGGLFVGVPQMEGVVEIRCRDGSRHRHGYVTANWHTRVKVEGRCGRMTEIH